MAFWYMVGEGTYDNIFNAKAPANADPARCTMIANGGNVYVIPGAF
jgi:hypothetical protein